jgi:hypothetical protein
MSDFIPYERYSLARLYPTGKCKKKTITYKYGAAQVINYVQCRVRVFGIPLWTYWVDKDTIEWRTIKEEIYNC